MAAVIRIGTQGWNYQDWVGPFYPGGTRPADYLPIYSRAFDTVEVDSTFYAIPAASTVRAWAERTPPGFRFAVKMPQEVTHESRLRDEAGATELFFDRMRELGDKLGPVLLQLPPAFEPSELPALVNYLGRLRGVRAAARASGGACPCRRALDHAPRHARADGTPDCRIRLRALDRRGSRGR